MTALARWKDLCLDASGDPRALGEFWATVVGLRVGRTAGPTRPVELVGAADHQRIWVNPVDRPKTVKNRLHLDVYAESVSSLEELGATVLARAEDTGLGWTVMADPEGHELCCFERPAAQLPAYRLHGIGVDCADAPALAAWWGRVFGVPVQEWPGEDFVTLERATPDPVLTLDFASVPEPRVGPNRVHWDVEGKVDDLLAAGATHLWDTEHWTVLADPEGNEFCVFAPE